MPPYRRPVNMMFQSYALFPHMTVEKNIAFGLQAGRHAEGRDRRARRGDAAARASSSSFAKRKPHQLSGGQRQRVALARALAKRPKVLLLDEPLGALDKKLREETQFELMDLQQELGMTFVVVTHDQEEAMTMADRIAVMDQGRIVQVATPRRDLRAPRIALHRRFRRRREHSRRQGRGQQNGLWHVDDRVGGRRRSPSTMPARCCTTADRRHRGAAGEDA